MKRAWLTALLLGAGPACSFLYDPSNAPPPPCPVSPDRCPVEPNALASCQATQCAYTCSVGWVDGDGDLGSGPSSNGCETACPACAPAPASLEAVVGVSGTIVLLWPDLTGGGAEAARVNTYRLYTGSTAVALTAVQDVPRSACDAGGCAAQLIGLPDNVRVYVQLRSVDLYGNESDGGVSPIASATPINGVGTSVEGWSTVNDCGAGHRLYSDGGVFEIDPSFPCITFVSAGDDQWQDYTYDLQVRILPGSLFSAGLVTGGPAFWVDAGAGENVLSATALPCVSNQDATTAFRDAFNLLNGSVACAPVDEWFAMRLVAQGGLASVQLGPTDGGPLVEIQRWRGSAPASGLIGLGATQLDISANAVQFRNLRLSTQPKLPALGPTSEHLDFGALPSTARFLGTAGVLDGGPCPSLPGVTACDAGECPPADAGCLFLSSVVDGGELGAAFDVPVGIDPSQRYEVRFGFAVAGPTVSTTLVRAPEGDLLTTDGGVLSWLGVPFAPFPSPGSWNAVDVLVDPDAGIAMLRWNGTDGGVWAIPQAWNTFDLSPLMLGPSSADGPLEALYGPVDITAR